MERKCKCGNFFDVREHSGICPECGSNIFIQSAHDKIVSKKREIIDAFRAGADLGNYYVTDEAENYYNEKYGK